MRVDNARASIYVLVTIFTVLLLLQFTGAKRGDFNKNLGLKTRLIIRPLNATYNPIIFIPGDGGSQLEARLNKTTRVHHICDLKSDWFNIWINIHLLAPVAIDCLVDNLKLTYNETSQTTKNTEGVEIRPKLFGALDSVDYLDVRKIKKTDYFENLISTFEDKNKLERNINMLGASYDFRKAPDELCDFFKNLSSLIETNYVKNNYRPVTMICHSMGCLNSLYFLNEKPQQWKDVFIKRLIALAAPWDGSFKAISAMLFGDNLGVPVLSKEKLQSIQSTFPSLMYLFPREPTFKDNVLVETPRANYTLNNLDYFLEEAGFMDQMKLWHNTRKLAAKLTAPKVELWCLYGSGLPTPNRVVFREPLNDMKYQEFNGDGDGSVNIESSRACKRFRKLQKQPVYTRMFANVSHIGILRGRQAADYISSYILAED